MDHRQPSLLNRRGLRRRRRPHSHRQRPRRQRRSCPDHHPRNQAVAPVRWSSQKHNSATPAVLRLLRANVCRESVTGMPSSEATTIPVTIEGLLAHLWRAAQRATRSKSSGAISIGRRQTSGMGCRSVRALWEARLHRRALVFATRNADVHRGSEVHSMLRARTEDDETIYSACVLPIPRSARHVVEDGVDIDPSLEFCHTWRSISGVIGAQKITKPAGPCSLGSVLRR
jgi:hypothetical protein